MSTSRRQCCLLFLLFCVCVLCDVLAKIDLSEC